MTDSTRRKVFILGLDGATFRVLDPLIASGRLPAFAALLERGASGILRSTIPPNSPVGWSSFMTGKNAGKHGLFGFFALRPGQYELALASGADIRSPTMWELLSEAGRRVAVINMPYTYPPRPVNGVIVGGMDAPEWRQATYPPEFAQHLLAAVPGYTIELNIGRRDRLGRKAWLREHLRERLDVRARAMRYVLDVVDPDVFAGVFTETDRVHHFLWDDLDERHPTYDARRAARYRSVVIELYEFLDGVIGEFIERLDETSTLIVLSDHGFCGTHKTFFVNHWLLQRGWLALADRPAIDVGSLMMRFLRQHPTLYHWARATKNALPLPALRRRRMNRRALGVRAQLRAIDWSQTRAYYINGQGIRLNLRGREPMGIVEPSAYDPTVAALMDELREIRDPETNARVFARVARRTDIYAGDWVGRAADIILVENIGHDDPRKNFTASGRIGRRARDRLFRVKNIPGHHDDRGIILAMGRGIKSGVRLQNARLIDLAPTVLYLSGVPIPRDMDGRVLMEMFTEDFLTAHPPQYRDAEPIGEPASPSYDEAEQAALEERLRNLGYLG